MPEPRNDTRSHDEIALFAGDERFQLLSCLGEGGMGAVYETFDRERNARVALKILRSLGAEAILRFKNEFRGLQDLQHPNLVTLGELYERRGHWFFTMELVHGTHFLGYVRPNDRDRDGSLPRAQTLVTNESEHPTIDLGGARPRVPAVDSRPASEGFGFEENRLRHALEQLTRGLMALHAAGKVHRDVKPSNVLVTEAGRLVLLDFGVAVDVEGDPNFGEGLVVGTTAYMAPEQAAGRTVGPEADWYAVGVVLYQALTGGLPFVGAAEDVLRLKQRVEPPSPGARVLGLPADLELLCTDLLRLEPQARPGGRQILSRLHGGPGGLLEPGLVDAHAPSVFVGRGQEIGMLERALADSHGRPVAMLIHGESGIGKSALVRRFTERAVGTDPRTVVLRGRCFERESVPYKAVDGVMDALSRYLLTLPEAETASLLPARISLLAQTFPVLRRVPSVEGRSAPILLDPQELRTRMFAAMRELLRRVAADRPLIVAIDDLQWTDADSLVLLREILRGPEDPHLLILGTLRPGATAVTPALDELPCERRHLHIGPLPPKDAQLLAGLLFDRPGASGGADQIAEEAAGHPLFIGELARHAVEAPTGATVAHGPALDDILWARVQRLEAPLEQLVELVAVAGAPLESETVVRALGIDLAELERRAGVLRGGNLVRTTGLRRIDCVEVYHDRVREAVLAHVGPAERQRWHRRLAETLESSPRAEPAALAVHWRDAGEPVRAAEHMVRAADRAAAALAFDRAARLYRMALELRPEAPSRELLVKLGDALASAGRGGEAADVLLQAADGAEPDGRRELERRAAEQLLLSGRAEEGMRVLQSVMETLGMSMPHTPRRAVASLLVRRARVRLRGLSFRERAPETIDPRVLVGIDSCWSVAMGLGMVDSIRGADFQARHLLLALKVGDPFRVVQALVAEVAYSAARGWRSHLRTQAILSRALALAERLAIPYAIGLARGAGGVAAALEGRWREARRLNWETETFFSESCNYAAWELDSARVFNCLAMYYLGDIPELSRRQSLYLQDARDRGDLYACTHLRTGIQMITWLARDDARGARRNVTEAMSEWAQPGIHVPHVLELQGHALIDLYEGNGASAYRRVLARWDDFSRAYLLQVQYVFVTLWDLRGRSALAAARKATPAERKRLLGEARRAAGLLEAEGVPWAGALAALLRAGLAAAANDPDTTRRYETAAEACDGSGMALHAAAARFRAGEAVQGEMGAGLVAAAEHWMRRQEIQAPRRMVDVLAP